MVYSIIENKKRFCWIWINGGMSRTLQCLGEGILLPSYHLLQGQWFTPNSCTHFTSNIIWLTAYQGLKNREIHNLQTWKRPKTPAFPRLHRLDKDGFQHRDGTRPRSHLDLPRFFTNRVYDSVCQVKDTNIDINIVKICHNNIIWYINYSCSWTWSIFWFDDVRCLFSLKQAVASKDNPNDPPSLTSFGSFIIIYFPNRNEDYFYRTFPTTKRLSKTCFAICFSAHPYRFSAKHWHPVGAFGEVSAWWPTVTVPYKLPELSLIERVQSRLFSIHVYMIKEYKVVN